MFPKTLTLRGFKSFADPAVLEFEPGVTVVVGPNGSGKSNVVDAVAWVLGAQGPRTVRSAKMEDVIFAGSVTRPALGRAEVSLTIDNSAGKLPTDLAEITITRTLFRSGESEYAINGAPCRLLDVQELLSDTGVGRQQHVIISQGQLDAILSARPEDRRAVIEEAAGVLKYRRRRERSERRLAATDENLERLFDLVREVKRQIRPLERQAAAARSHDELAGELYRLRLAQAGEELRALDGRREAATAQRTDLQASEARWRATVAELDEETGRTTDELSARREADLSSSLGRVEGLVERSRGLAGVLRERRRGLQAALDAAADADVVANLEAEAAKVNAELAATGEEAEAVGPERAALAAAEQAAGERLAAHGDGAGDGGTLPAAEALAEARRTAETLSRGLERDRADLTQVESRLLAGERRVATLGDEEIELTDRLAATEQDRHRLQGEAARAEAAHAEVVRRLDEAEEALRLAEQEHHRSEARADALERALDEARGAAGAELLTGVEGVVGTLLDLVEVDEGWEAALEAAAGGSLAAVVVSGSAAARRALDLLRSGEATGAVLALGASGTVPSGPPPPGAEPVRSHVRARTGAADPTGLGALLDRLLADAFCTGAGWTAAIDLALSRPDLVVVTRDGDRFSQTGWRVRAAGGVVTAALVEEARRRAVLAGSEAERWASERSQARTALEARRAALAEAVRADDRNEADHQGARAALARVAADRAARAAELDEIRLVRAELAQRIERDGARLAELEARLPGLAAARDEEQEAQRSARAARRTLEEALAAATSRRTAFEVGVAALEERRRVLEERLTEIERRLAGHAEERRQAEANRSRLERDARAIDGLAESVDRVRGRVETILAAQRDEHRRQIEAVRAGGARLEELRRRRAGAEHELAASRSRLQSVELELAESAVRRESVVETLGRELGASAEEALAEPVPALDGGVTVSARVEHLQAELERLGPVNPLALEELSGLSERHTFLEGQVEDVRRARRELQHVIRTLDEEIMRAFDAAFADVSHHFGELVSTLFPGGTGRLSLTDPERLLDTGVEVEVRPAGRNVRRLSLLSGGERSLVAMAFLFAVFRRRPSPFYLMDEVEAALDDVNLHRFLGLVHEFRDEAQLIIVSHQKRTMESGDALYGVTMAPGGSSKVVSQKVPRREGDRDALAGAGAGADAGADAGGGAGGGAALVTDPAAGS